MAHNFSKEDSGNYTVEVTELMERALHALGDRAAIEKPFTPDLAGAVAPMVESVHTIADSFSRSMRQVLESTNEVSRSYLDEGLRSVAAKPLLFAGIAAAQIPAGGSMTAFSEIRVASGALRIPWLEIIKEIIAELLALLPLPPFLKAIILEILRILDKLFGGMPHELAGE